MRPGELIRINGEDDARKMLKELSKQGIGAVVCTVNYKWILITSVPDPIG